MKFKAILPLLALSSLFGFSPNVSAMSNPSPTGVYWGIPGATVNSSPNRDIVYWNDPVNNGSIRGYGTSVYQDIPNSILSNGIISGAGTLGSSTYYLVRQSNGILYLVDIKSPDVPIQVSASMTDTNWQIAAFSDLNKDGNADIIWRNVVNGQNAVWFLNSSGGVVGNPMLPSRIDINWDLRGVGDFNGDGNLDLLWYHKTNGQVETWHLNSAYQDTGTKQVITTLPNALWAIRPDAAADFDTDGDADFLVHLPSSNTAYIIRMQGGAIQSSYQLLGQSNINASNSPSVSGYRDYIPLFLVETPGLNTLNVTSRGGFNSLALGDLGVLNPTSQLIIPSITYKDNRTDARYRFTVSSTSQLTIGVSDPNYQVEWTDQYGQLTGVRTQPGGFRNDTYSAGTTYYLRIRKADNAPNQTGFKSYDLIINPSVNPPGLSTDLNPGTESADMISPVRMGSSTYWMDSQGLWKSDGTTNGTILLKAGNPGNSIYIWGTQIFFGFDGLDGKGVELWKSDGSVNGTVRVTDINTNGSSSSDPDNFILFNGQLYFTANDGINGTEIWRSNGSNINLLAANINTEPGKGSNPSSLTLFNGNLVFSADNGNGRELFSLNTSNQFTLRDDRPGSANPQELTVAGSNLYYSAATGGQNSSGDIDVEPVTLNSSWVSTKFDINLGSASSTPTDFFAWGSDVYLSARGSQGVELFRLNSTSATQIFDINPGTTGSEQNSSSPSDFALINNRLIFSATDNTNGRELWSYTGSGSPTRISQIASGSASSFPNNIKVVNGSAFFSASTGGNNQELYRTTDGINVSLIRDINTGSDGSFPYNFVDAGNGKTIFSAFRNDIGFEPFITDGTNGGTLLVKDTNISARSVGFNSEGAVLSGWRYFPGNSQNTGIELYRTDGTVTQLVSDINPGVDSSNPRKIQAINSLPGWVYFIAEDGNGITKLYRTNGTNTNPINIINGNGVSDKILDIAVTGTNQVYVTAIKNDRSIALFSYNGTSATEIKNFGIGGEIASMKVLSGNVYLNARDLSNPTDDKGLEPWRISGTTVTLLGDINPGTKSSNPYQFVQTSNGDLYFAAKTDSTGYELYRSVGGTSTPAQFIRTADGGLGLGSKGSNIASLTAIGNRIYFAAYTSRTRNCGSLGFQSLGSSTINCQPWSDLGSGNERLRIWVSDGTDNGTYQDPTLTSGGYYPSVLTNSDKPNLEYLSYPNLMPVSTASGSAVYTPGNYGRLTERSNPGFSSTLFPGESCTYTFSDTGYRGRQIGVSVLPGNFGIHKDAFVSTPVFGVMTNQTFINNLDPILSGSAGLISVTPASSCMFAGTNSAGNPQLALWTGSNYDVRLAGYEDIILGNVNGIIYIAGWKSDRYEVWSMPHSETFTTRYLPNGEVAPRNLTYRGFFNFERGSFKFETNQNQMIASGFSLVTRTNQKFRF